MSAVHIAVNILVKDEFDGKYDDKPYYDTKHIPTIGHGFVCIVNGKQCRPYDPLPDQRLSEDDSLKRLRGLAEVNEKTFINNPDLFAAYKNCNDVQKATLLSMAHQLGIYGVLKFKCMLGCLYRSDFASAAKEVLDSDAARQDAPNRFQRNSSMIRTGQLHEYYK
jgi:GH24 family phage-related lysozyme (muramidase)